MAILKPSKDIINNINSEKMIDTFKNIKSKIALQL